MKFYLRKDPRGDYILFQKMFLKDATEEQADQGPHEILIDLGTSLSGLCSLIVDNLCIPHS